MAAFAFLASLQDGPVTLPETTKEKVFAALGERSPGQVEVHEVRNVWAAVKGPWGGLFASGNRLLLCDGTPETGRGRGGGKLLLELADLASSSKVGGPSDQADGFEKVMKGVHGSFAACYFDRDTGVGVLVRDRFGTRPVFYAEHDGLFMAASECKALQALGLPLELDTTALRESLAYRWVTGESSLLSPTRRVPRGSILTFGNGQAPTVRTYWHFRLDPEQKKPGDLERYQDLVEGALRSSLRNGPKGNGRVGILLSGGVDSSLLAALAAQEFESCVALTARVAGFDNFELARAQKVTAHLGMEHRVVDIDPGKFAGDFHHITRRLEELPRHPNDLVVLQLLREAAKDVDVVMQGDAADTLLGGRFSKRLRKYSRKRDLVRWIPPGLLQGPTRFLEKLPSEKAWKAARILAWDEARYLQARDAIGYKAPIRKVLGLSHLDADTWESGDWRPDQDPEELRRGHLVSSGIQGSLIRHDRLSRPEGVESWAPFLVPEILAVATRMPRDLGDGSVSKPVLRALCDKYLPPEVSRWKKGGFQVPWGDWMFGALHPLCQEAEKGLKGTGYLPEGFLRVAIESREGQGAWSGMSLYLVLKQFGLLE